MSFRPSHLGLYAVDATVHGMGHGAERSMPWYLLSTEIEPEYRTRPDLTKWYLYRFWEQCGQRRTSADWVYTNPVLQRQDFTVTRRMLSWFIEHPIVRERMELENTELYQIVSGELFRPSGVFLEAFARWHNAVWS